MTDRIHTRIEQGLVVLDYEDRLQQVKILRSKELTLREIAARLNISPSTVWTDLDTLNKRAKHNISKTIEKDLPLEFDLTIARLKMIIKRECEIADESPDNREVTAALALVKECSMLIMAIKTQAQLMDRAINVVRIHRKRRRIVDEEITEYTTAAPVPPNQQSQFLETENVD